MNELTMADRIALYVGGGLVLLGVVGIGLLEMVAGSPHPVSGEGQIIHDALVPIEVRSYIILLGLLVWAAYAVYKVVATTPPPRPEEPESRTVSGSEPEPERTEDRPAG